MRAIASATVVAAAMILSFASAANAEFFIPPGNSGATQYTQSLPTAGGGAGANGGAGDRNAHPGSVIGKGNAKKLEAQGAEGREVAEVVAATAPADVPPAAATAEKHEGGGKKTGHKGNGEGSAEKGTGGQNGGKASTGGPGRGTTVTSNADPAGATAVGQVAGKVTGLATGGSSLLLPLLLLAAAAWAIAFTVRRRRQPAA